VYAAPDGAFAVVRLEVGTDGGARRVVTAVGPLGAIGEGEAVRVEGTWERHPTFGEQLRVERAVALVPASEAGVERYLAGLKGLGPETARRLVAAYGTRAIDVVTDEPWRAAAVRGVGKRRAGSAADDARARRGEREVMVFLQGHGVSAAYAARIRKKWGDAAIVKVRENPYRLAREVPGIGFFVADRIARGMGIEPGSPLRIEAALYHALETASDEGHVYAPRAVLRERAGELVAAGRAELDGALDSLALQGAVILEEVRGRGGEADTRPGRPDGAGSRPDAQRAAAPPRGEPDGVWLPRLRADEVELASGLGRLLEGAREVPAPRPGGRAARELERLSAGQRRAVDAVRGGGVAVITGGPGTGKTTVMKAAVALWEEARLRVKLAAPTGRAAKRLAEATGRDASTVHRLLEWGQRGGWGRDEARPVEADLVVVDEASMLDVRVARALVAAVRPGATLLLVGDVDQLPSVGPGQVLADVIASGVVPVARLTEIFRQAHGSRIVETAHEVLAGVEPRAVPAVAGGAERREDLYVIPVEDAVAARDRVVRLCRERIPRAFGLHPSRDIQVLTPMHRGDAGTESLNRALQEALNPERGERSLPRGARPPLRVGDKVLQGRNDYDREVWNGDIGEVVEVDDEEGTVAVSFDERRVDYEGEAVDQLELAYAVSIHKSQGSEYPAVVITLLPEHFLLLRRNLLYTAITRGKRLVVIVGSPRALRRAVENSDAERRYTMLRDRLASAASQSK
jgi:exodeoxyribonuclease V alpha subunit